MLELTNLMIRLAFDPVHAGLCELTDVQTAIRHIQPAAGTQDLWQASFTDHRKTITLSSTAARCTSATVAAEAGGTQVARFEWRDLDLGDERGAVTVRVTVELPPESGLAE